MQTKKPNKDEQKNNVSSFSYRLQLLMRGKKITQAILVRETGLNKSTVSQWVGGSVKAGRKNCLILANYFGCDPDWLQTGEGSPEETTEKKITFGSLEQRAKSIHQINGDSNRILNIHGQQYQLSALEQSLIEVINKLPDKEDFILKTMREALQELERKKKE